MDDDILTWSWARTEVVSALERRFREHKYSRTERRSILVDFVSFIHSWDEFSDMRDIQTRAHELLARYPLRAADAGHLAAALIYRERSNEPLDFVCLDNRLSGAAVREGFHVWPEPPSRPRSKPRPQTLKKSCRW